MVSTGSLITKKVIAYSFKDLMKTKDFQKISIKEIMSHADYRRQTFYDHFVDKYELLEWCYQQDIKEVTEHLLQYEHWQKIILRLLSYLKKNQLFYQKILLLPEPIGFETYFVSQIQLILKNIDEDIPNETIKFLSFGVAGYIKEWLMTDCIQDETELAASLNKMILSLSEG
ncbi:MULTISPECIES: dihydroxyacetone kinase transcriptional activator DhaS [Vagococcus]|uniref:Transcriptional regulator, TetR family n=1 Tax=Vagococcus fluvialis bH819 TaxID=1255619 RepID=A0A1X6WP85_9ENTE|nr:MULTISPECIES: dihydroxyacetone kinase transcriptional activator DhaS [Vagococcus]SLM86067.1 Transcriptional regulator, TetR family [Vagococcus fluvialis bH819]HCM90317.1 dihydroxyacetone kinase transcriptional activator DhaS [Vagococcus sp.]